MRPLFFLLTLFFMTAGLESVEAATKPNLLILTVDDMSADSIGAFGCKVAHTTPAIDQLAGEGLKFQHAHMQVGNCMPSRNVLFSGCYPHTNGVEGFFQVKNPLQPHFCDLMQQAGYLTGIRGKVSHSTPYIPYHWDVVLDADSQGRKYHMKDVASYGASTASGIQQAKKAGKPFALVINISDPHKPFYSQGKGSKGKPFVDPHVPSKIYTAEEMVVPGFLPDDPVVREELALYYSSVRRADDAVKSVMEALNESGEAENTFVLFLSDHGMPLPFAKTQLYHHSTNSPWIIRWPGKVAAGTTDAEHMISAVDVMPTLCELVGIPKPSGMEGRSFLPLLEGQPQTNRDFIIKEYNENAGGWRNPMRAVQTKTHLYLFNPWSDGKRTMKTATTGTSTYRQMAKLAKTDPYINQRHQTYQHRVVTELYNVQLDADCLVNLVDQPAEQNVLQQLEGKLADWMQKTNDPLRDAFEHRQDVAYMSALIDQQQQQSDQRKGKKQKPKPKKVVAKADRPVLCFMIGEEEYGTDETLPAFAKEMFPESEYDCRFVMASSNDRSNPLAHEFPGLKEKLTGADVLIVSIRRRYPKAADLQLIRDWVAQKKPIIGIRTACHAFGAKKGVGYQPAEGHESWDEFDRDAFGADYINHYPNAKEEGVMQTEVRLAEGVTIPTPLPNRLTNMEPPQHTSPLYKFENRDPETQLLLEGFVPGKQEETQQPIAWLWNEDGRQAAFVSLGGRHEFSKIYFRRWLAGLIKMHLK